MQEFTSSQRNVCRILREQAAHKRIHLIVSESLDRPIPRVVVLAILIPSKSAVNYDSSSISAIPSSQASGFEQTVAAKFEISRLGPWLT
jgi:hypothetical protein